MVIPENKHVPRIGSRTYNRPTVEEVAVIIPDANLETEQPQRVISLRKRGASGDDALQTIHSIHPNYDPLQFPLLFPYADRGWQVGLSDYCQ